MIKAYPAIAGSLAPAGSVSRSTGFRVPAALAGSFIPAAGVYDEVTDLANYEIDGSTPPRIKPYRFGLCFQMDPGFPGTLEQQAALRQIFEAPERHPHLTWYFARAYKAYWAQQFGDVGQRNFALISINGNQSFAQAISIVLSQFFPTRDLQLTFCHEWGHLFDRYVLTAADRQVLMDAIGDPTEGDWFDFDGVYWDRPAELFAWGFQRLVFPEDLPPHTMTAELLLSVMPDFEAEFNAAMGIDD